MVKKMALGLMLVLVVVAFSGCAHGSGNIWQRAWRHFEWHVLGAYKDLVKLHEEVDMYIFNLDQRDPDRY